MASPDGRLQRRSVSVGNEDQRDGHVFPRFEYGGAIVLLKALIALVPITLLCVYSGTVFAERRSLLAFLLLAGSGCLMIMVLTHVCEALDLFPSMRFGEADSAGHYLDLTSAVLGVALLLAGLILRRVRG
jgi:hypothetical protein